MTAECMLLGLLMLVIHILISDSCHNALTGKKGRGFWEGGKGTRDPARMSRKGESLKNIAFSDTSADGACPDPRKYKRRPGTKPKS